MKRFLLVLAVCFAFVVQDSFGWAPPADRVSRIGDPFGEMQRATQNRADYVGKEAAAKADRPVVELAQAPDKPVRWEDKPNTPNAPSGRRELTIRQRREMGLTVVNMVAAARELKEAGEIDRTTSDAEIAAAIAMKLESKNPQAFSAGEGLDWDTILAFIERLLPIILKLIALF